MVLLYDKEGFRKIITDMDIDRNEIAAVTREGIAFSCIETDNNYFIVVEVE